MNSDRTRNVITKVATRHKMLWSRNQHQAPCEKIGTVKYLMMKNHSETG